MMKRLIALAMALVLMLGCTAAFADNLMLDGAAHPFDIAVFSQMTVGDFTDTDTGRALYIIVASMLTGENFADWDLEKVDFDHCYVAAVEGSAVTALVGYEGGAFTFSWKPENANVMEYCFVPDYAAQREALAVYGGADIDAQTIMTVAQAIVTIRSQQ